MRIDTVDPETHCVAELIRERRDDGYWIGIRLSDGRGDMVGPFETQEEADRALADLDKLVCSLGGIEVPGGQAN